MNNQIFEKTQLLIAKTKELLDQKKIDNHFTQSILVVSENFAKSLDYLREKPRDAYDLQVFLQAKCQVKTDAKSFFRFVLVPAVQVGLISLKKLSSDQYAVKNAYVNYFNSLAFMSKYKSGLDGMIVTLPEEV